MAAPVPYYVKALVADVVGDANDLRWNRADPVGTPATVSYSFFTQIPDYAHGDLFDVHGNYDPSVFHAFTPEQRVATVKVLAQYSEIANLTFVPKADDTNAQMHFAQNEQWGDSIAYAYLPYPNYKPAGDVWLSHSWAGNERLSPGQQGYATLTHEIGHALGFKHPFDTEPGGSQITLTGVENTEQYTLMAYNAHPHAYFFNDSGGMRVIEPSTPMLYDVAAIQYLYGANSATRAGDTVYSFSPAKPFFECIWDGGGSDTISVSRFSLGCDIDLRAGHFSDLAILSAPPPAGVARVYDGTNNLSIAYGAVIENATGGAGGDLLRGNSAANALRGNAGDDTLTGGAGADRLTGGAGHDTFSFSDPAAGADVVTDFTPGEDRLQFDDARFAGLAGLGADQMFAQQYLSYDAGTGRLYYDADGGGTAEHQVLVAKLNGHPVVGAADITII